MDNNKSLLRSPLLNTPKKKKFNMPSWKWSMLKPKLPELPHVAFSRTEDNLVRATFMYKGTAKFVDFQPEKFFKQTVKVIREIKSFYKQICTCHYIIKNAIIWKLFLKLLNGAI